jgi:phosphoenolpyruvate synthase/pyruvate phosphate dikinase
MVTWIHPLSAEGTATADVLGDKAHGLVVLMRLGLPVPPGFVIGTPACRAFLRDARMPHGLVEELAAARHTLDAPTVSVRSGASVSMPGMMTTVLDVNGTRDLRDAVATVFGSWTSARARAYRELNGIPHDLGTAVIVQAMVFGDRDGHSGSGVAFSRDPMTGERVPSGDVLCGHRGDDVVSGRWPTRPLSDLAAREPSIWDGLRRALRRVEAHYRDACHVEFTYESGDLWLLQVRRGGFAAAAAVRIAVDLVDEGVIDRDEALLRVPPHHLLPVPRLVATDLDVLARGRGVCPGVAVGAVATTADRAVRMAPAGPAILVRPETSPLDLHGLAAAAGIVTAHGGSASHAAVVARAMGRPAVVGIADLTVADGYALAGRRVLPDGATITIDGTGGEVVLGAADAVTRVESQHARRLLAWADEVSGNTNDGNATNGSHATDHGNATGRPDAERLRAAHAALRRRAVYP